MFDTINLYIRPILFLCTTPMLQYRESLIFNNLKDISTTRTATCGAILLFSILLD
nr:MAG TPA: hypothetical protein [Caudoviricetes sp.]